MKILLITPSFMPAYRYGGTTQSIYDLSFHLASNNRVMVLTTNQNASHHLDVKVNIKINFNGIKVIYHRITIFKKFFCSIDFVKSIFNEAPNSDVVHIQSIFFLPAFFASIACRWHNVPYVVSPRGALVRKIFNKSRFFKLIWMFLFGKYIIRNAQSIITTSFWESKSFEQMGFDYKEKYVIPNGVSGVDKVCLSTNIETPSRYILFVGRISYIKGLDRLIESLIYIDKSIKLLIAGNDEENYKGVIEKKIKTLGLESRVIFTGEVSDEKWFLYEKALVTILPSYSENFGNVVLEAMSIGCPVVVSSEVGAAHVVEECNSGEVSNGEPLDLSEKINRISNNIDLNEIYSRNGITAVKNHYSWKNVIKIYEEYYRSIIGRE
jgi:glycosyltransferase involved in cell wall biosynthesis